MNSKNAVAVDPESFMVDIDGVIYVSFALNLNLCDQFEINFLTISPVFQIPRHISEIRRFFVK